MKKYVKVVTASPSNKLIFTRRNDNYINKSKEVLGSNKIKDRTHSS